MKPRSPNGLPPELAGASTRVRDCHAQLEQAAADERGVLVVAEQGLDAEAVARALHGRSARRAAPFVVVSCTGEPQDAERILFGSPSRRNGDLEALSPASALARAHRGVLFLHDLSELPAAAQRRLARVLRDGEAHLLPAAARRRAHPDTVRPARTHPVDVRLVGATGSLSRAVDEGHVLDELARRLPLVVDVPSLGSRREDIGDIARQILCETAPDRQFTPAALTVLAALPWRRNIAELRGLIDRLASQCPEREIRQEDVLAEVQLERPKLRAACNLREARRQFEREHIASVLRENGWRMREAARALGMERANLYRKARQLGIPLRRGGVAPARMTR